MQKMVNHSSLYPRVRIFTKKCFYWLKTCRQLIINSHYFTDLQWNILVKTRTSPPPFSPPPTPSLFLLTYSKIPTPTKLFFNCLYVWTYTCFYKFQTCMYVYESPCTHPGTLSHTQIEQNDVWPKPKQNHLLHNNITSNDQKITTPQCPSLHLLASFFLIFFIYFDK